MNKELSLYEEKLYEDFSATHKISRQPEKFHFHVHSQLEIVLSLTDELQCRLEHYETPVPKFHLLLLNHSDLHCFFMDKPGNCDRFVFYFSPALPETLSTPYTNLLDCFYLRRKENCHLLPIPTDRQDEFFKLAEKISSLSSSRGYGTDLELRLDFGRFLLAVNRLYLEHHHLVSVAEDVSGDRPVIYQILDYIQTHYSAPIHTEMLTSRFPLSRGRLYAAFRAVTGTSPAEYIVRFRLTKAKEFLASGYSVELAGQMAGFPNLAHFSHTFKLRCGIGPKQFQKQSLLPGLSPRSRL